MRRKLSMQPTPTNDPLAKSPERIAFPQDWLVSLATTPLLIAALGTKALHDFMLNLSTNSEEILRGDRLPILHFPQSQEK
ncbi:conserved hypothetical protein [Planktothrix sp. PCC 11201]|uniref:hypothetical protein n=1 Tax=Planktothrix sp. PCC 11201 TaxID=1729650 RepID=UPI00091656E5|nr:hypothetical protein [Planktothrix sp. PCC 11201]SKB15586.1 conserved hypothetical protein [Planktothrix sp. PCC 11201]